MQKWGICTDWRWLFLSNLNLWVAQLLFLELLDFRIPAHTYGHSWAQEQELHMVKDCHLHSSSGTSEMREVPATWHPWAEQDRAGGALKSSVVGPENDNTGFLSWLPVIVLELWTFSLFPFSASEGRAVTEVRAGSVPQVPVGWSWQRPELELLSKVGFSTNVNFRNGRWQIFSARTADYWGFVSTACLWFVLSGFVSDAISVGAIIKPCQDAWGKTHQKLCVLSNKCSQNKKCVVLF